MTMSKKTRRVVGTGIVLASVLAWGCARAPHDEVDRARSALDAATLAESEAYAPESFAAASKALSEALAEVDRQKRAPFFSRSFRRAKELLSRATDAAHETMAQAEKKREEARLESQELIRDAKLAVTSARKLAEHGRGPRTAKEDWKTGIESAFASLFQAESAFEAEQYLEAHRRAEDAKAEADEVAEAAAHSHARRRQASAQRAELPTREPAFPSE
jgi:hypothetical protein